MDAIAAEIFRIQIVDNSNEWPVPLVELKTTQNMRFVSDNIGVIAFDLPVLMNVEAWLHVEGHGYSVDKNGFGYRGIKVIPRAGQTHTIRVKRELPAKRLGRIAGANSASTKNTNLNNLNTIGCTFTLIALAFAPGLTQGADPEKFSLRSVGAPGSENPMQPNPRPIPLHPFVEQSVRVVEGCQRSFDAAVSTMEIIWNRVRLDRCYRTGNTMRLAFLFRVAPTKHPHRPLLENEREEWNSLRTTYPMTRSTSFVKRSGCSSTMVLRIG